MAVSLTGTEMVIRPSAVVPVSCAAAILEALQQRDVSQGGVWNATAGVWQRYDQPWAGPGGSRGGAELVGSIAVVYDSPRRNEITIYKAIVTAFGMETGWSVEKICDDALSYAGLTLATCPRTELRPLPAPDPFRVPSQRGLREVLNTDVGALLRTDLRDLFGRR